MKHAKLAFPLPLSSPTTSTSFSPSHGDARQQKGRGTSIVHQLQEGRDQEEFETSLASKEVSLRLHFGKVQLTLLKQKRRKEPPRGAAG